MSLASLMICAVSLTVAADAPLADKVTVQVYAIQATNEGRPKGEIQVDPKIAAVKDVLSSLPFDTFTAIKSDKLEAKPEAENAFKINDRYTLVVTPLAKDDEGRIRMQVRLDETVVKDGKKVTRKALESKNLVSDDKPLVLGGTHLDEGQLVVVLAL